VLNIDGWWEALMRTGQQQGWEGREDSLCPLVLPLSKDIKRKLYSEATKSVEMENERKDY